MRFRIVFCALILIFVFSLSKSDASDAEKTSITHVNANALLCTIAENQGLRVIMLRLARGRVILDQNMPPTETIAVGRQDDPEKRGRRYEFTRGDSVVGGIQLGVFQDPNSALRIYEDHLSHAAIGPDLKLDSGFGTKSVGWSHRVEGKDFVRILFVRDNTVVSIDLSYPRFAGGGGTTKTITAIGNAIDAALANGTLGVRRGHDLKVPRIVEVRPSGTPTERAELVAEVRVAVPENPEDKNSREAVVVRTVPFYTPGLNPEDRARPENKVTYQVTYITPGCVVVSTETTLTVQRAASSR